MVGEPSFVSPLGLSREDGESKPGYVVEGSRVLLRAELPPGGTIDEVAALDRAGPHERLFFDPGATNAAILTAGGLCPGTNNVIRAAVHELIHKYGVRSVLGIRFGYAGLDPASGAPEPMELGLEEVRNVHRFGGTMLGTSRGGRDPRVMVDTLVSRKIGLLLTIGGDGTMRGAHALAEEIRRRNEKIGVVGIPKTIDNDIPFVDSSFGFETAVAMARMAIEAAHTEALSVQNGIGLVKLMGREAGFIAAYAAMASHDVNVCLVPEVPFRLDGPTGLLSHLEQRLATRSHAVVVVAEGCGKKLLRSVQRSGEGVEVPRDASGNLRFASPELDIGEHLKIAIERHFAEREIPMTLKYIDPSYMVRGVPANAVDAVFGADLARHAVHAGMAGKTDMMIGRVHSCFVDVPLPLVHSETKRIDPNGDLWLAVTSSTGQPIFT